MQFSNRTRAAVAVAVCAAVGAAGGIAGSAAAPGKSATANKTAKATKSSASSTARARPTRGGPGGPAVHSERVVLNKAGDAFITETEDNGKIKSISGREVTITEAIGSVTYKDVTIDLPASATIERNGKTATVGDLKDGDRIHVTQSSDGVRVHAADASFRPKHGPGHRGPGGPPPRGRRPG